MEKGDLTYRIIGCAMRVHTAMGRGFREYIYCRALSIELKRAGIAHEREIWLPIHFGDCRIGHKRTDFLIEENVAVEVKARGEMQDEDLVQAISTVKVLNKKDGLLLNFGAPKLQYKHIFNKNTRPESDFTDIKPEDVGEPGDDLFSSRHYLPDWEIVKIQQERLKGKFR